VRTQVQRLHDYDENADQSFFHAWFRGKYAASIRPGKAGAEDQDFELIGSRFHNWFRDNHRNVFKLETSDDFYNFFKEQFPFYVKWYLKIWDAQVEFDQNIPHAFYVEHWGIAESLQYPLLLASINLKDDEKTIQKKIDFVSRYIETFTVRRAINTVSLDRPRSSTLCLTSLKQSETIAISLLGTNLSKDIVDIPEDWDGVEGFVCMARTEISSSTFFLAYPATLIVSLESLQPMRLIIIRTESNLKSNTFGPISSKNTEMNLSRKMNFKNGETQ
jgi:hypothetical protein